MIRLNEKSYQAIVHLLLNSRTPVQLNLPELVLIGMTPLKGENYLVWNSNTFYEPDKKSDAMVLIKNGEIDSQIAQFSSSVAEMLKIEPLVETNLGVFEVIKKSGKIGFNPQTREPITIAETRITFMTFSPQFLLDCKCKSIERRP